ncbi:MAG: prepilin-type N-terminal cleavage/methylation domain-containing protein [bacterium]|nr:prepilin-type N-terminal cleavage/methylation domain-containing protein [bacterium]
MKTTQRGFTIVETLLALLIVAVIGFGGYYVWHTRQTTKSIDTSSNQTTQSTASATKSNQFVFKELGVQITLPDSLKGLSYSISTTDGTTYLGLSTPAFVDALHKCDSSTANFNNSVFVSIAKIPGQYDENSMPGTGSLKQFPDFFISGASPNGIICDATSQQDQDQFSSVFQSSNAAVSDAFKTATLTQ